MTNKQKALATLEAARRAVEGMADSEIGPLAVVGVRYLESGMLGVMVKSALEIPDADAFILQGALHNAAQRLTWDPPISRFGDEL